MKRKTIILTKEQLNEICGEDFGFSYFDSSITEPDSSGYEYSTHSSAEGDGVDGEYSEPMTTDDFADMQSKDWPRDSRAGRSCVWRYVGECTKREFEEKAMMSEEKAHGNKRLNNRKFGNGKYSYGAMTQKDYRINKKTAEYRNAQTPEEKEKALVSLSKMVNNGGKNYKNAKKQFDSAKNLDTMIQSSKPAGTKIESGTREQGNGKGHSNNNIFIIDMD